MQKRASESRGCGDDRDSTTQAEEGEGICVIMTENIDFRRSEKMSPH